MLNSSNLKLSIKIICYLFKCKYYYMLHYYLIYNLYQLLFPSRNLHLLFNFILYQILQNQLIYRLIQKYDMFLYILMEYHILIYMLHFILKMILIQFIKYFLIIHSHYLHYIFLVKKQLIMNKYLRVILVRQFILLSL